MLAPGFLCYLESPTWEWKKEGLGIAVPLHPHPILPFQTLSSPTLAYLLFQLLESQAVIHLYSSKYPMMRVIGFCDLLESEHQNS